MIRIDATERDSVEELLRVIEDEGWNVEGYDVDAQAPRISVDVEVWK